MKFIIKSYLITVKEISKKKYQDGVTRKTCVIEQKGVISPITLWEGDTLELTRTVEISFFDLLQMIIFRKTGYSKEAIK